MFGLVIAGLQKNHKAEVTLWVYFAYSLILTDSALFHKSEEGFQYLTRYVYFIGQYSLEKLNKMCLLYS